MGTTLGVLFANELDEAKRRMEAMDKIVTAPVAAVTEPAKPSKKKLKKAALAKLTAEEREALGLQ